MEPIQTLRNAIKHWYLPLITGVLLIAIGAYLFTVPLATYLTLTILFSTSFLVAGFFEILFSLQNSSILHSWGWYLVGGLLTFATGVLLVMDPAISITVLPFIVGFILLFRSFQGLGYAFDLKQFKVSGWGSVALLSVLGIIFSFLLLAHPLLTGLSLATFTALSFISSGIAAIMLSLKLKKWHL